MPDRDSFLIGRLNRLIFVCFSDSLFLYFSASLIGFGSDLRSFIACLPDFCLISLTDRSYRLLIACRFEAPGFRSSFMTPQSFMEWAKQAKRSERMGIDLQIQEKYKAKNNFSKQIVRLSLNQSHWTSCMLQHPRLSQARLTGKSAWSALKHAKRVMICPSQIMTLFLYFDTRWCLQGVFRSTSMACFALQYHSYGRFYTPCFVLPPHLYGLFFCRIKHAAGRPQILIPPKSSWSTCRRAASLFVFCFIFWNSCLPRSRTKKAVRDYFRGRWIPLLVDLSDFDLSAAFTFLVNLHFNGLCQRERRLSSRILWPFWDGKGGGHESESGF